MKKALRLPGVHCFREDGTSLKLPPGPCEIDERPDAVVRVAWRRYGRDYEEFLLDADYLRCLARGGIRLVP